MLNKKNIDILKIAGNYGDNLANKFKKRKIGDRVNLYPNEEFFPYACYFDKQTILTQNGELLKIIKIPSFIKNSSSNALFKLRSELQDAIKKYANDTNINFWFTTVRKEVDIIPKNQLHTNYFSKYVNDKWNKYNNFDKQYANEIYISIIIVDSNRKTGLFDNMIKNLFFRSLKKSFREELNKLNKTLTKVTDKILKSLDEYNPEILSIVNIEGNYYSEHCKFFSTVINNDRKLFPLDINNLGYGLANHRVIFHSNNIYVSDEDSKTYMALISLKNYNNLLLSELDKIIQLDQELVITQTASFLKKKTEYKTQINEDLETLDLLEDSSKIKELTGLDELKDELNKPDCVLNFSISQVLIQIKGKTQNELANNIKALFLVLKEIGLIGVREEMFMPTLYWSQLPANFNFIKRLKVILTEEICQFVSLYNFPTGKLTGNLWGDAITVLKSTINTPYFFSFHNLNNEGNTLIVSPDCEFRTMLLNFLVSESSKTVDKVYFIDMKNRSKIFINAMGGTYYELSNRDNSKKKKLVLNPFILEKKKENINFIVEWVDAILRLDDSGFIKMGNKKTVLEEEIKKFNIVLLNKIHSIININDVYNLADINLFPEINRILTSLSIEGKYGFIFNNETTVDLEKNFITGFNLSNMLFNDEIRFITVKYLLQQIYNQLDGTKKVIIAVDEIWDLFDNKYLNDDFKTIVKKFSAKNAIFVATTSGSEFYESSFLKEPVTDTFTTYLLLYNMKASVYQKKIFGISEQEARLLSVVKKDSNVFLLKHNKNMIFTSVKFDFLEDIESKIFCSNKVVDNAFNKAIELANSNDPCVWLPIFKEIILRYNKYTYEKMVKEQERRQIEWQESKEQINKIKN